jgi:hypothetical protein
MSWKDFVWVCLVSFPFLPGCEVCKEYREIPLSELRDRIRGGWAGQMIGVSFGAPTEFRYLERIIPSSEVPKWTPDRVHNSLNQDDLYVEMSFVQVLDEKGLDATTENFGEVFRGTDYPLWHANLAARRALKRGVPAGQSGRPEQNAHANDIDFQIESDFIGLMSPGLPAASNEFCRRVGSVMNSGDGICGGMFVSGMYTAAFFENDVRKIVEAGLACLPVESPYAQVISDVLAWSAENPDDWEKVWQLIEKKWNRRDPCPAGALLPFNIDAKLNGAYIALGLLFGQGDLWKTLEISSRAGQDSDCNPSNAAGVLGVMLGYERIPDRLKRGIPEIANQEFSYTKYSFNSVIESTERRAVDLVLRYGGRLEGGKLLIAVQEPRPAELEIWDDYAMPAERIGVDDARWGWKGSWQRRLREPEGPLRDATAEAQDRGSEATISFQGTGAILVGPFLPNGGKAEVFLDDNLHRVVDVYSDEQGSRTREAVWHAFGLEPEEHTLRVVVTGETFADSQGTAVRIRDLVVFR